VAQSASELHALETEWRGLLNAGVTGDNLLNSPAYLSSLLELEPDLRPWVVVVRHGERLCGIAPFVLHATHLSLEFSVIKLMRLPVRMLKALGGQFVIAADADATAIHREVFELLWRRRAEFGLVRLDNLPVDTLLWEYCQKALAEESHFRSFLTSSQVDVVQQVVFPATHEAFMASLSYDTRRKLRRYARRLQSALDCRLERITEPEQVPYFLAQVDAVFRNTWQARVNGYLSRQSSAYVRFFTQLSRAGYLRSYLLTSDKGALAFALGHQYGGIYYFLETGYCEAWSKFSPGIVLMHLFLEDLIRHDRPKLLDFIQSDQPYKRSFSNARHGAASLYLSPPNCYRVVLRLQQCLHLLSRSLVRALQVLKLDAAARRLLRRH